ncbi:UDP-glucose:undecaprenyl-phosphate glucose-1-phosphate transferase [Lachnospiraceae bacterium]|nr:UDP-glucose:undecaprenyl-phosphate glucose-1-phosphate transferase [Lachnospiraceae bacterium]
MENIRRKNKMIETYSILLIDILGVVISYALSLFIRFHIIHYENYPRQFHLMVGTYIVVLCLLYNMFLDANRNFFTRGYYQEFYYTVRYTLILVVGLVVVLYLTQQAYEFSRSVYGIFAILNTLFTYVAHMVFKKILWKYYRKSTSAEKMLVITKDFMAEEVIGNLLKGKEWYYDITAVVVYDVNRIGEIIKAVPVVAAKDNLYEKVVQMMVDEVFICLPGVPVIEIRDMVQRFEEMGLTCHYNVDLFRRANPNTYVQQMAGYSVISFALKTMDSRRMLIKRLIDILGALVGLFLTALLTPFVALAIKIDSPGPVFFSQTRIGKNGRRFKIWKFRSMYLDAEERKKELQAKNEMNGLMFKMEDDPRVTKVGRFLRRTSIDETPQFLNILIGNMSLVGTRPPTEDEFEQYSGYYRRRMSITPGLTGLWQVSGRSDIQDFEEIVKMDLEYIDNWSLGLDIKILFMTVFVVLRRKGSK